MTAPAALGALLVALVCAGLAVIAAAMGWTLAAVVAGVVVVFLVSLALAYVIPAAHDELLEQENAR